MNNDRKIVPDIDYANSILKNRLVYNRKGWFFFEYVQNAVLFLLIIVMLYASFQEPSPFYRIVTVLIFFFLITNFIYLNSLVKVQGQQPLINKENAIITLNHFYENLTFAESKENILRDVHQSNGFSGRCITLLFHDENVYFHIATLGRADVINPVTAIFNYYKCKKIADTFLEKQKTNN